MKTISKLPEKGADRQATFIMIMIGIQIVYAGYLILKSLLVILSLNVKLLGNPAILFSLVIYAMIVYTGISFFRGKEHGWYGEASLYIILLLKNLLIFISIAAVLLFKKSLFNSLPLPAIKLNGNVVWTMIEFLLFGCMAAFLFSQDTINEFRFGNTTRAKLILQVAVIVVIAIALYLGGSFLLHKL